MDQQSRQDWYHSRGMKAFDPTKCTWASYESMLRHHMAARNITDQAMKKAFLMEQNEVTAFKQLTAALNGEYFGQKTHEDLVAVMATL